MRNDIELKAERRLCKVNGKLGYFHCWEHYSTVIEPSPMIGGHPGGVISYVRGIVEFPDGVRQVPVKNIEFCDEINAILTEMTKHYREE